MKPISELALDGDVLAIQAIIEENASLRADAERYRWLRAQHWSDNLVAVVFEPKDNVILGSFCPYEDLLDDLIDKEMRSE